MTDPITAHQNAIRHELAKFMIKTGKMAKSAVKVYLGTKLLDKLGEKLAEQKRLQLEIDRIRQELNEVNSL